VGLKKLLAVSFQPETKNILSLVAAGFTVLLLPNPHPAG
jgi:hypothetical protein